MKPVPSKAPESVQLALGRGSTPPGAVAVAVPVVVVALLHGAWAACFVAPRTRSNGCGLAAC